MAALTLIGPSGDTATVENGAVAVRVESDFEYAVRNGNAYSWSCLTYDYTAINTILAVENNSPTMDLHIQEIHIQGDTASQFIVHTDAGLTVTGGNVVTGVNLNRNSGNNAAATSVDCDTGNTGSTGYAKRLITGLVAADGNVVLTLNGCIVLPNDHTICVDLTDEGGACNCTIIGYYKTR